MQDNFYLIPHIAILFLVIGFIGFVFLISPEIRKLIKRNKKIAKRKNNIKQASKARDYQI
jgi:preprotein translocase subunit YajC